MPTKKELEEQRVQRNKAIAAKRQRTIAMKVKAVEQVKKRKERRKKFMELSAKPIVWIFAIFGFGNAVYWIIKGAVKVIEYLSSHWI